MRFFVRYQGTQTTRGHPRSRRWDIGQYSSWITHRPLRCWSAAQGPGPRSPHRCAAPRPRRRPCDRPSPRPQPRLPLPPGVCQECVQRGPGQRCPAAPGDPGRDYVGGEGWTRGNWLAHLPGDHHQHGLIQHGPGDLRRVRGQCRGQGGQPPDRGEPGRGDHQRRSQGEHHRERQDLQQRPGRDTQGQSAPSPSLLNWKNFYNRRHKKAHVVWKDFQ